MGTCQDHSAIPLRVRITRRSHYGGFRKKTKSPKVRAEETDENVSSDVTFVEVAVDGIGGYDHLTASWAVARFDGLYDEQLPAIESY